VADEEAIANLLGHRHADTHSIGLGLDELDAERLGGQVTAMKVSHDLIGARLLVAFHALSL